MFIEELYNERHKYDYFAMKYLVKVEYDETKKKKVEIMEEYEPIFIRGKYDNEEGQKEITCLDKGEVQERIMILPILCRDGEELRDVLYLSASAGSGKSYFLNMFCKIYHMFYPKNELYFLTCNDFKQDKSLDHEMYKNLNMNDFIDMVSENQEEIAKDGTIFKDSIVVLDDVGVIAHDKKKERNLWQFVNTGLENARKRLMSLIIVSHVPTNYKLTSVLVREATWYIPFPGNQQVKSDRFLNCYLGLNKKQVHRITDEEDNSRWVAINCKKKLVVSEYKIYSLKDTEKPKK